VQEVNQSGNQQHAAADAEKSDEYSGAKTNQENDDGHSKCSPLLTHVPVSFREALILAYPTDAAKLLEGCARPVIF
jgi:hypothetical protein